MYKKLIIIVAILLTNNSYANSPNYSKAHIGAINIYKHDAEINNLKTRTKIESNSKDVEFERQAERIAKELQDVLAAKLLNVMYEGMAPNPVFGGGHSEKMFQSMLNDERAKLIDLGLVKPIKTQIMYIKKGKEIYRKNEK